MSCLLGIFIFLSGLDAWGGNCIGACRDGKTYVYRGDSRSPDEIRTIGFAPVGNNQNLANHLSGATGDSGYISTTRDIDRATVYAMQAADVANRDVGYVYEIELSPDDIVGTSATSEWVDVVQLYPNDPAVQRNQEIAHRGAIAASRLRRVYRVDRPDLNTVRRERWGRCIRQSGNPCDLPMSTQNQANVSVAIAPRPSCSAQESPTGRSPTISGDLADDFCQLWPDSDITVRQMCAERQTSVMCLIAFK